MKTDLLIISLMLNNGWAYDGNEERLSVDGYRFTVSANRLAEYEKIFKSINLIPREL